jgi:hypothetical protein
MAELIIVTGVMGGGKSYFGAETALKAAREGAIVHTNMPFRWDVLDELGLADRFRILPNDLRSIVKVEPGEKGPNGEPPRDKLSSDFLVGGSEGSENVVIIDEASLEFDIDEQMAKGERERNKPLFQLVALTRHVGLDFYFLAQHQQNVNAKLRRLAARRVRCIKTETLPLFGWLLASLPWCGTFRRKYYNGEEKTACAATWHKFDPLVGSIYDTHGMRGGVAIRTDPTRRKAQDAVTRKGKLTMAAACAFVACCFLYACSTGSKVLAKGDKPAAAAAAPEPLQVPVPAGTGSATSPALVTSEQGTGKRSRGEWVEWHEADEIPYSASVVGRNGIRVYTSEGVLAVGRDFWGERITKVSSYAGWFYFWSETGRIFVARPYNAKEREERRQRAAERAPQMARQQGSPLGIDAPTFGAGIFKGAEQ